MSRFTILLSLLFSIGCSDQTDPDAVHQDSGNAEIEDGGGAGNVNRDKAEQYFARLREVRSAEEEKELLTEFGEWLRKYEYRVQVNETEGKHHLACPYFPPVTPGTEHSFHDVENLELLPRLNDGG